MRNKAYKTPLKRILILCEGSKTEPVYFQDLVSSLELVSVQVDIEPSPSTCPLKLVQYAEQRYKDEGFDVVYCVFDKDMHEHYERALSRLNGFSSRAKKVPIYRIDTVPCFEYWLILHFLRVTGPYVNSAAVLAELKKIPVFAAYQKAFKGAFDNTRDLIHTAVKNAEHSLKQSVVNETDNATTRVHKLVMAMFELVQEQGSEVDLL